MRDCVLLMALGLWTTGTGAARADITTFDDGDGQWQFSGAADIVPDGGNPGANMGFHAIDTFGVNVTNDSNPAFIGDVYRSPVTIGIDVRTDSITFRGNEVSRSLFVELRDTTTPNSQGLPWTSVFFELGTLSSSTPGWVHYSVTIADPTATGLPPGWVGYGAEDANGNPILPPDRTFASVLENVDVINFTTFAPGFFYGFTNFDLAFDNLGVTPVPEPSACALLAGGLLGMLGARRLRRRRRVDVGA
jgi:hypothetical protein